MSSVRHSVRVVILGSRPQRVCHSERRAKNLLSGDQPQDDEEILRLRPQDDSETDGVTGYSFRRYGWEAATSVHRVVFTFVDPVPCHEEPEGKPGVLSIAPEALLDVGILNLLPSD